MEFQKKILAIIQIPPPVHGSAIMNKYIYDSKLLKSNFQMDFILYNFVEQISEIGKFSFKKYLLFLKYLLLVIFKLIKNKPDLIYFPIVPYGVSFYRDSILVFFMKLFKVPIVYHLHGKGASKHYDKNKI